MTQPKPKSREVEIPNESDPVSEAFIHAALACGFVVGPKGLRRVAAPRKIAKGKK